MVGGHGPRVDGRMVLLWLSEYGAEHTASDFVDFVQAPTPNSPAQEALSTSADSVGGSARLPDEEAAPPARPKRQRSGAQPLTSRRLRGPPLHSQSTSRATPSPSSPSSSLHPSPPPPALPCGFARLSLACTRRPRRVQRRTTLPRGRLSSEHCAKVPRPPAQAAIATESAHSTVRDRRAGPVPLPPANPRSVGTTGPVQRSTNSRRVPRPKRTASGRRAAVMAHNSRTDSTRGAEGAAAVQTRRTR